MRKLFKNATIITMVPGEEILKNASMVIEGDQILSVGEEVVDESTMDEVIDVQGNLLLPGFINTHGHAGMSLLRGYADDLPLKTWLEDHMWPIEARYGEEQVRVGTYLAVAEMIRGGTTCFADMYAPMEPVAEVVEETGMRASLCRGVIGLGPEEEQIKKWKEAYHFAKTWNGKAGGRITTMMAPHAPYTCTPEYITRIVESAAELGVPIHTHMSETAAEVEQNVEQYGARPVEHLRRLGVFELPTLVAHAVHLNDEEIAILAEYDVKISHNPGSNLKLGSGIAPVPKMLQQGIRPSLGTDSAASNNNLDLLEEIRLAALIHKGVEQNPEAVPAATALAMGTVYGAEALFLSNVGVLAPGKQADFIIVDTSGVHMHPPHDLLSHLVYAASRDDVRDVYVAGRPLMKNRELLTVDEEKIRYETQKAFAAIAE